MERNLVTNNNIRADGTLQNQCTVLFSTEVKSMIAAIDKSLQLRRGKKTTTLHNQIKFLEQENPYQTLGKR